MSGALKRQIVAISLVIILLLALSYVAMAQQGPVAKYVYYENADGDIVKVDYSKAVDDLFDEDPTLMNAIRDIIHENVVNDRAIYIECTEGKVIDYLKAVKETKTYPEAYDDPDYNVEDPPEPEKELIIENGNPVEVPFDAEDPDPDPDTKNVSTASEFRNALADEYAVINFTGDITLEDLIPAVDYPVTINLGNHELRLDGVDFIIEAQDVVVTAAEHGKIVGEEGHETLLAINGAEVTYKGQNPNPAGIINFENIEMVLEDSNVNMWNASFDGADDDIIPLVLVGNSTVDVRDSEHGVEVKSDAVLLLLGVLNGENNDRPTLTGNGLFHGAGRIETNSTIVEEMNGSNFTSDMMENESSYGLDITGDSSGDRLSFDVSRMDIIYARDIDLRLANLTLDNPVWLDNGSGFDSAQLGVKVTGDLDGDGTISGRETNFDERITVLNSCNIDELTFRQLRLDINEIGRSGINVSFSAAEPVTFTATVDAFIAGTANSFTAAGTVDVEGDLTFIYCAANETGAEGNIQGTGPFEGDGKITYQEGTTLTVTGNKLTFDVVKYVEENIEFANLELLRRVFLSPDKIITVTGDIDGDPVDFDSGKIIGAGSEYNSVVKATEAVTFTHMNFQELRFEIATTVVDGPNVNYNESAFDKDLTALIQEPGTLDVYDLKILGDDVYVEGDGTFTGNRVFGDNDINFRSSGDLNVKGGSWFTFEVPIRLEDDVKFADLEFKEVIYEYDNITVYVEGDLIAWQDGQDNIHGVFDGRNVTGEAIVVDGNDFNDTTFYNITLNDLDIFEVRDRRAYIKDELGTTKEYAGETDIGMDVRGGTGHAIVFDINADSSLILENAIKKVLEAVDLYYDGGDELKPGAVRGQNGPAVIRSTADNPITIAENSRLLFMGHRDTNLEIDARLDIADVNKVKMGIIDLMRRVTNLSDNELYVFPDKIIHVHDNIILQGGDLDILTDIEADRPPITAHRDDPDVTIDSYIDIIEDIKNPVQGIIQGEGDNITIRGANNLTLGDRLKVINLTLSYEMGNVNVELDGYDRKVLTLKDVIIQDQHINFRDYLVWLKGDLELVREDVDYPELYFEAGNAGTHDTIAILYGEGNRIHGDGGVAFESSQQDRAVAQDVEFDIGSTSFPNEVMILGGCITEYEYIEFVDLSWTSRTTVQVGDKQTERYPTLRFVIDEQDKIENEGSIYAWKDGATDEDGLDRKWNLANEERIEYYNIVVTPDAPFFEVEFEAKQDPVVADSEDNEVEFKVTNTGGESGEGTVTLYVGGNLADESDPFNLAPDGDTTGTLLYDAPAAPGDIVLRLETADDNVEQTVTVDEQEVYFEPSISKEVDGVPLADGDEVELGDVIDVEWKVVNAGNVEGTQDISRKIYIDGDLKNEWGHTVTLEADQLWTLDQTFLTDAGLAQGVGTWEFVLETEDYTYEQTVQVVVPEGQVYNETQETLHATIQEAVDAADSNDTIQIGAGEYDGFNLTQGLTIQGVGDVSVLSVDLPGEPRPTGIFVQTNEDVTIENIKFKYEGDVAADMPNGILTSGAYDPSLHISGCEFVDLHMGIYFNPGASGTITHNTFTDINHCAIGIDSDAGVDITNNTIENASVGLEIFQDNVTYSDNVFINVDTEVDDQS